MLYLILFSLILGEALHKRGHPYSTYQLLPEMSCKYNCSEAIFFDNFFSFSELVNRQNNRPQRLHPTDHSSLYL